MCGQRKMSGEHLRILSEWWRFCKDPCTVNFSLQGICKSCKTVFQSDRKLAENDGIGYAEPNADLDK